MDEIRRLRELHEASTEGPWVVHDSDDIRVDGYSLLTTKHGAAVLELNEDAEWIVEAHRVWPALLAVAEAAEGLVGDVGDEACPLSRPCDKCRVRVALVALRDAAGAATEGEQR
jgi:hypothetical protein